MTLPFSFYQIRRFNRLCDSKLFSLYINMYKLKLGKDKKYNIIKPDGDVVKFGQKGASDYTLHKDKKR